MEKGPSSVKLFRNILFPTEFSEAALGMVPYVREMACRFSAKVTVLHAFNVVHDYNLGARETCEFERAEIPYTTSLEGLRMRRHRQLDEFAQTQFAGVFHTTKLDDGDPATVIERVAHNDNVDLIVMPTRGLGRFRRLLLGSVTEKVLHDVACAVLTGAHEPNPEVVSFSGYRSILCAVELNQEAVSVLNSAAFLAETYQASLCLAHIMESTSGQDSQPSAESVSRLVSEAWLADGATTGVRAKVRALNGAVPEGVRQAVIEEKADLVVVGRGHEKGTLSRMWSDLYGIIRESSCPVFSVSTVP